MRFSLLLFSIFLIFISCNKEQRYLNKLEGAWELDSFYISDQQFESNIERFTFETCNLKNDGFCELLIELVDGTSGVLEYKTNKSLDQLIIQENENESSQIVYSILNVDSETLILERDYVDNSGQEYPDIKVEYYFSKI